MKLKIFLLVVLNFLSAYIMCWSPTFAGMDDLFKDIDEPVLKQLSRREYPEVPYLPSLRFVHFCLLENMRFVRNSHNWEPDIPIHPQSVCLSFLRRSCPCDFRTSFVQLCFPSPDGVVFLANQAASDPVSKLTPRHIGSILSLIEGYLKRSREERDTVSFKKTLYAWISTAVLPSSRRVDYEELSRNYKEFLRFEFKNSLAAQMLRMLPLLEEDLLEEATFTRDDPLFYTKIFRVLLKRALYPDEELLKDGEVEEYIRFQQWHKKYKSLTSAQRAGAALGSAEADDFNCSDPSMVRFLPFAERRDAFSIFRFADTLTEALEEEDSPLEQGRTIYPGYCVQRTLVTFFWKKAGKIQDIVEFYSGLFEEEQADLLMPPLTQLYSETEYYEARAQALIDGIPFNSETALLLSRGFEVFEDPLPPLFYYGTSYFRKKPYSDCVETALRYITCCLARTKRARGCFFDPTIFSVNSKAREFFERFSSADNGVREEARAAFSDLISDLPVRNDVRIIYVKANQYEIEAGFLNMFNVLMHLFIPEAQPFPSVVRFEDGEEALSTALNSLMLPFNREGLTFSWRVEGSLQINRTLRDFFGTLIFQLNGEDQLKWKASQGHSHVECDQRETRDWRKTIPYERMLEHPHLHEQVRSFLPRERFSDTLSRIPPSRQAAFLYGSNLKSLEAQIEVIRAIATSPSSHFMYPLIYTLIEGIANFQDFHARSQLAGALIELSATHPFLEDHVIKVFGEFPILMSAHVEMPEEPKMSMILWAIKHKKFHWFERNIPTLTILQYLFFPLPWDSEVLDDFLENLPRFQQIRHMDIHSFQEDSMQNSLDAVSANIEKLTKSTEELTTEPGDQSEEQLMERESLLRTYHHEREKLLEAKSLQRRYIESFAHTLQRMTSLSSLSFLFSISTDSLRAFFDACPPSVEQVILYRQTNADLEEIIRSFFHRNKRVKFIIRGISLLPEEKEVLHRRVEEESQVSRQYLRFG